MRDDSGYASCADPEDQERNASDVLLEQETMSGKGRTNGPDPSNRPVDLLESVVDTLAETHVQESEKVEDTLMLDYGGNDEPQCSMSLDEPSDGNMSMELTWIARSASRIDEPDLDVTDVTSELETSNVIELCVPKELQVKTMTSIREFKSKELRPPGLHPSIAEEHIETFKSDEPESSIRDIQSKELRPPGLKNVLTSRKGIAGDFGYRPVCMSIGIWGSHQISPTLPKSGTPERHDIHEEESWLGDHQDDIDLDEPEDFDEVSTECVELNAVQSSIHFGSEIFESSLDEVKETMNSLNMNMDYDDNKKYYSYTGSKIGRKNELTSQHRDVDLMIGHKSSDANDWDLCDKVWEVRSSDPPEKPPDRLEANTNML